MQQQRPFAGKSGCIFTPPTIESVRPSSVGESTLQQSTIEQRHVQQQRVYEAQQDKPGATRVAPTRPTLATVPSTQRDSFFANIPRVIETGEDDEPEAPTPSPPYLGSDENLPRYPSNQSMGSGGSGGRPRRNSDGSQSRFSYVQNQQQQQNSSYYGSRQASPYGSAYSLSSGSPNTSFYANRQLQAQPAPMQMPMQVPMQVPMQTMPVQQMPMIIPTTGLQYQVSIYLL